MSGSYVPQMLESILDFQSTKLDVSETRFSTIFSFLDDICYKYIEKNEGVILKYFKIY